MSYTLYTMTAFLLIILTAAGCPADQVLTRSGDLVTGRILSERDGYVVIRDAAGVEVIPGNAVVRVTRNRAAEPAEPVKGIPGQIVRTDMTILTGVIIGDNGMHTVLAEGARPGDTLISRIRVIPASAIRSRTFLRDPGHFPVRLTGRTVNTGLVRNGNEITGSFGMAPEAGDLFTTYAGGVLELVAADGSGVLLAENSDLLYAGTHHGIPRFGLRQGTVVVRTGSTAVRDTPCLEVAAGELMSRPAGGTLAELSVRPDGATTVSVAEGQSGILQPAKPDMEMLCEAGSRISAAANSPGPLEYGTLEQTELDGIRERAARLRTLRFSDDPALFTPAPRKGFGRVFGFVSTPRGRLAVGLGAIALYGLFYIGTYVLAN